jgi:HTH-type transcriptional repressor of NAD biosynthesis genes
MKLFKSGMVLGKFYPFHKGHELLVNVARRQCAHVYVFVCSLPTEYYAGVDRARWVRETFPAHEVTVIHVDEVLPQYPHEHPDFWALWTNVVTSRIKQVEAIFTSEDYGDEFARHLGAQHVMVDQSRHRVPISGTICRQNIYSQWDYLPMATQDHFRKQVCVVGPESTGKSTLCEQLAKYFRTSWVPEYGREYTETIKPASELLSHDFVDIGFEQMRRVEKAMDRARGVLFTDTNQLVTRTFYRLYEKTGKYEFNTLVDAYLANLQSMPEPHLYLLLTPEVAHVQDGQRDFGAEEQRWRAFNIIRDLLEESNANYVRIKGSDYQDRFEQAKFWTNTLLETAK